MSYNNATPNKNAWRKAMITFLDQLSSTDEPMRLNDYHDFQESLRIFLDKGYGLLSSNFIGSEELNLVLIRHQVPYQINTWTSGDPSTRKYARYYKVVKIRGQIDGVQN